MTRQDAMTMDGLVGREDDEFLRAQIRKARIWACLLDFGALMVPAAVFFWAAFLMVQSEMQRMEWARPTWRAFASDIFSVAFVVVPFLTTTLQIVLLSRAGQTLGKRVLGLRIVRSNGERAGFLRAFVLRDLAFKLLCALPLIGTTLLIADVISLWRADGRCLHDRFAGTVVVSATITCMPNADGSFKDPAVAGSPPK